MHPMSLSDLRVYFAHRYLTADKFPVCKYPNVGLNKKCEADPISAFPVVPFGVIGFYVRLTSM